MIAGSRNQNERWESDLEDLWVILEMKDGYSVKKISLCGIYLPPPVGLAQMSTFTNNADRILDQIDNVLIIGDFNQSLIT